MRSEFENEDRFSRFRLISWWDQERLKSAKILVIGAGALGNEILKNLALLGVGDIFVADMDLIENSNLCRSILFREEDNGSKKAEIAANSIKRIYPDINVQWFCGDIIYDLGVGVYEWADLVIAGLDNREARLSVNRNCWRTKTPWIDGAIERLNGVARVFVPPDGACYECTMGETDWQILKARKACSLLSRDEMLMGRVPTTPTSAAVIAGIQCQEAVKYLHGLEVLESKAYHFNGLTHQSYTINYQRKDDCLSHETYGDILRLDMSAQTTTLKEMLQYIRKKLGDDAIIEFNKEILYKLICPFCEKEETLFASLGKVTEKDGICPVCGKMREVATLHSIDGSEPFLDKTFHEIGIPLYDVIVGRNGLDQIYILFNADAPAVLGNLFECGKHADIQKP